MLYIGVCDGAIGMLLVDAYLDVEEGKMAAFLHNKGHLMYSWDIEGHAVQNMAGLWAEGIENYGYKYGYNYFLDDLEGVLEPVYEVENE